MAKSIAGYLATHPTAHLIQAPVIIHRLPRLSGHLGHDVFVLRDDLTGFGIGGNKSRKVDFLFGDALAQRATTVATVKATSFSRNAAAAAAVCGLDLHVVLPGREADQNSLSRSLFRHWGAQLYYGEEDSNAALSDRLEHVVRILRASGKSVYVLHPGGSDAIGALSYVNVFAKICAFSERHGVHFSHIFCSTSSAGTQAGLIVGQCIADYAIEIIGISASRQTFEQAELIRALAVTTSQLLGAPKSTREINVVDTFVGPGYAQVSPEGESATRVFGQMEGILFDSVDTAKAAAAMLSYVETGKCTDGPVLFLHTGGNGGAYY